MRLKQGGKGYKSLFGLAGVHTAEEVAIAKKLGFMWLAKKGTWLTQNPLVAEKALAEKEIKVYPRVKKEVEIQAGQAHDEIKNSYALKAKGYFPVPEGKKLFDYQKAGIAYITSRRGTLLADDVGLGKTIQAVGAINLWGNLNRILIICPASIKTQWEDAVYEWSTLFYEIYIVRGTKDHTFRAMGKHKRISGVVIINYCLLKKYEEELKSVHWDLIVVDECHNITNSEAQRTKVVLELEADKKILLSATPAEKPIDLWVLLSQLDRKYFGDFWHYAFRYCAPYRDGGYGYTQGWVFKGAENLGELNKSQRASCMIRRTIKDTQRQLPEKIKTLITYEGSSNKIINLVDQERRLYEEDVMANANGSLSIGERMASVLREIGEESVGTTIETVDNLLKTQDKIVIFVWHRTVGALLYDHYNKTALKIDGETSPKNRQAHLRKFTSKGEVNPKRILIGQIASMGEGVDGLQKVCSVGVFAEVVWSYKKMYQAEGRLWRTGQKNPALYYYIAHKGTLSATVAKRLITKEKTAKQITGEK